MSTKTSIKRIALVAVSALGFGLLSVVPAKAAVAALDPALTADITSATDAYDTDTPGAVGSAITFDLNVDADAAGTDDGDVLEFTVTITNPNGDAVTSAATYTAVAAPVTDSTVTRSGSVYTLTIGADGVDYTGDEKIGAVSFVPKMAGVYTIDFEQSDFTAGDDNTSAAVDFSDEFYVSGAGASVAATGKGTTTVGAVTGGIAKILFGMKAHTAASEYRLTSSGVGRISNAVKAGDDEDNGTVEGIAAAANWSEGALYDASATAFGLMEATVTSNTAGVQTLTWTSISTTTGAPSTVATVTVTWGAAPSVSATYSRLWLGAGATAVSANETVALPKTVSTGAAQANITINLKDADNQDITGVALSVTITGPGLVSIDNDKTTGADEGTARTASITATGMAADSTAIVGINADGTAGTATITVSAGTLTLATKTVYFYGTVSKLNVTQNLTHVRSSSTSSSLTLGTAVAAPTGATIATTPAVIVEALDDNGNTVPGLTITGLSSDLTALADANVVESDGTGAGDNYAGEGYYNASVTAAPSCTSGKTATMTFRTLLATGAYVSSAPVTFTCGSSVATGSVAFSFDKATYSPGEIMKLTVTAKDSAGNPIFDQNVTDLFSAAPVFSKSVTGSTPTASVAFIGGKKVYTAYAPALDGAFNVTAALNPLVVLSGATVTASATVTGGNAAAEAASDAAAEAIDAANAATDAANLAAEAADAATVAAEEARDAADAATAAVEALATEVATLMAALKAQITTLANTVAKIAKKVKA